MINQTDQIKIISTKSTICWSDYIFNNNVKTNEITGSTIEHLITDDPMIDDLMTDGPITDGPITDGPITDGPLTMINKKPISRNSNKESDNQQIRLIMNMFNKHMQNEKNNKRTIDTVYVSDDTNDTIDLNNLDDNRSNRFSDLTPLQVTQLTQLSILPIGDVSLELIIFSFGEGQINSDVVDIGMPRLKKDYVTFIINSLSSDVVKYSVYALLFNNSTSVMDVIYKRNMDIPTIIYSTTNLDPTDLINDVYYYQTHRPRSLKLKSIATQQNNPNRLIPLSILQLPDKRPDLYFTNDILVQTADDSLIELQVIIRNHAYVSETPNEDLLKMIITMISF
jgi:hypothetical protein